MKFIGFQVDIGPSKPAKLGSSKARENRGDEKRTPATRGILDDGFDLIGRWNIYANFELALLPLLGVLNDPRLAVILRTIAGDLPFSRSLSSKLWIVGALRSDSLSLPMIGTMCRSTCSRYCLIVARSSLDDPNIPQLTEAEQRKYFRALLVTEGRHGHFAMRWKECCARSHARIRTARGLVAYDGAC